MNDICSVDYCDRPRQTNGYCGAHDRRARRGSDMNKPIGTYAGANRYCSVTNCVNAHSAHGYCPTHVARFLQSGDADENHPIRGSIHYPIQLGSAHSRCRVLWGSPAQYPCAGCGESAQDWAYDGTDPTQLYGSASMRRSQNYYSRYPEFYMPLCRKCHRVRDGAAMARELGEYRTLKIQTGMKFAELLEAAQLHATGKSKGVAIGREH